MIESIKTLNMVTMIINICVSGCVEVPLVEPQPLVLPLLSPPGGVGASLVPGGLPGQLEIITSQIDADDKVRPRLDTK